MVQIPLYTSTRLRLCHVVVPGGVGPSRGSRWAHGQEGCSADSPARSLRRALPGARSPNHSARSSAGALRQSSDLNITVARWVVAGGGGCVIGIASWKSSWAGQQRAQQLVGRAHGGLKGTRMSKSRHFHQTTHPPTLDTLPSAFLHYNLAGEGQKV